MGSFASGCLRIEIRQESARKGEKERNGTNKRDETDGSPDQKRLRDGDNNDGGGDPQEKRTA